jgi:hypothetical protein
MELVNWSQLLIPFIGFLVAGAVFLRIQNRRRAVSARHEQELSGLINLLALEFPEEVRSWGGTGVLHEPARVDALVERLSGTASASSGENDLRQVLRNSLVQRLADALEQQHRLVHWALWPVVVFGFLAGTVIGWLVGEILYKAVYPARTFPNAFREGEKVDFSVIGAGLVCGLLVWGGSVVVTAVLRSRLLGRVQGQLAGCIRELSTEFPDEVRAWGGEAILRDLYSVRELLHRIKNQPLTPA